MIQVIVDNRLRMHADDLPTSFRESLQEAFTHSNPQYAMLKSMGKYPPASEPKEYVMWRTYGPDDEEFSLPRGGMQKLRDAFDEFDLDYELVDNRSMGSPNHTGGSYVDSWQLSGDLFPAHKLVPWEHQTEMVAAANQYGQILMQAPTGSGKSSAIIKHIAEAQVPALIIMWDSGLLTKTWQPRLEAELGIAIKDQGLIRGPKCILKPVTLAMQQTLARWTPEKWERLFFKNANNGLTQCIFGSVYADECFEADTPVLMSDGGTKRIADVQVGDVTMVGGMVWDTMVRDYAGDVYGLNGSLVTSEHPVATTNGWVPISKIRGDDIVWDAAGELRRCCARVSRSSRPLTRVYNIETEHNVYVAASTLVHNCQRYAARTFIDFIDRFDCHYRIGVSADPKRKDRKTFIIYDMFGKVRHEVSKQELVKKRIIHDVECYVVPTNFRAEWWVKLKEDDLLDPITDRKRLLDEMAVDEERNELAVHLIEQCVQAGLPTLAFTQWVDHARRLDAMLTAKGIASGLALGGKDWEAVFNETLDQLRDGKLQVGCGTFGKLGVGHDIPTIASGVAVAPIHNKGFLGQVKGRICRTTQGKENARIIVMWDRLVFGDAPLPNLRAWNDVCRVWNEWDNRWQDIHDYMKEMKHGIRQSTSTTAASEDDLFQSANASRVGRQRVR